MGKTSEATDTDLKAIEELTGLGWKRGDTLLYQQEYALSHGHRGMFILTLLGRGVALH